MSSTPANAPIPIVLIGIHSEIGAPVAEGLRPDFDVIRFIQTPAAAQADLPHLLRGQQPPNPPTNAVGSEDFTHGPARAVLFGRGFSQRQAEELYAAHHTDRNDVVWIAGDEDGRPTTTTATKGGAGGGAEEGAGTVFDHPPPGIDKVMVPAFRGALEKWLADGAKAGLVLY